MSSVKTAAMPVLYKSKRILLNTLLALLLMVFNNSIVYAADKSVAWHYLEQGRYDEAKKSFTEMIKIDPNDAQAYNGLGEAYREMDQWDEALKRYKEAIRIDPDNSNGYTGLGDVYRDMGKYDEAIKCYKEAIRIDPDNSRGYYKLGRVYDEQGKYDEALKWCKEAVRIDPDNSRGFVELAGVYEKQGKYDEALKWYNKSVKKDSFFACAYEGLGMVYRKLGKISQAEENLLMVVKIEQYRSGGYYELAKYYYKTGQLSKASGNIEKALSSADVPKKKQRVLQLKGFILIMQGDYAQAEQIFKGLRDKYGISYSTLSGLGHIYNARKDYKTARKYFEDALKFNNTRDDDRVIAMLGLGWVNANERKHKEAIACYEKVLKEEPLEMLALLSMGNAYNWLGQYDKAEKYFKRVLEIDKHNEYALAGLGTVHLNKGDIRRSEELLTQSLKVNNSTYSCPYEGLGVLYLQQGKTKEAEDSFKKAIEINPTIEYKKYNGLAKIYIKQGKLKEAKELLDKSIQNYPYDNEAKELLKEIEK